MNYRANLMNMNINIQFQTIQFTADQENEPDIIELERELLQGEAWKTSKTLTIKRYIHCNYKKFRLIPKFLVGDSERFQQAAINLIQNAL